MTEVTVIGLGNMGSALARALIAAGADVTVWNPQPGQGRGSWWWRGARSAVDAPAAVAGKPRRAHVCD